MHKILLISSKFLLLFAFIGISTKCTVSNPDNIENPLFVNGTQLDYDVATSWNSVLNNLERYTANYKSPIAARSMAYINLAAYESIVPGMSDRYNSIAGNYLGLTLPTIDAEKSYMWPIVMNSCYKYCVQKFYPTAPESQQAEVTATYNRLLLKYSESASQEIIIRSTEFGRQMGEFFYNWSKEDTVGDKAYLNINNASYTPPAGLGNWQPTLPDFSPAVLPDWAGVRTFASSKEDFSISEPMSYDTDASSFMYKQMNYIRKKVNYIKANPDNEGYWIAQFWSDDFSPLTFTPAGRWDAIATQIIIQENLSLAEAATLYAKVSLALSDAAVGCWNNKFKYNVERPVDYIRANIESDWNTMMKPGLEDTYHSPATPAYPSEHATYGAAVATVLTSIFGDQYKFTDRCHEGRTEFKGEPRTFYRFEDVANECGYSRIQIGVCSQQDVDAGLQLGNQVGRKINSLQFEK